MFNFLQTVLSKVAVLTTVVVLTLTTPFHSTKPLPSLTPNPIISPYSSVSTKQSSLTISPSSKCYSLNGLPDPNCTPGIADPKITQDNIYQTICVSGYTKTVRPPSSYTDKLKVEQIKEYAYADTNPKDYEEDHLIALELGGSPTDPKNLWAELGSSPNPKDRIENLCHKLVCNGQISLSEAQKEIATDWHNACRGSSSTNQIAPPSQTRTTQPSIVSVSPVAPAIQQTPTTYNSVPATDNSTPGNGATALCIDGSYSYAAHHQGACSHHGGVSVFYR